MFSKYGSRHILFFVLYANCLRQEQRQIISMPYLFPCRSTLMMKQKLTSLGSASLKDTLRVYIFNILFRFCDQPDNACTIRTYNRLIYLTMCTSLVYTKSVLSNSQGRKFCYLIISSQRLLIVKADETTCISFYIITSLWYCPWQWNVKSNLCVLIYISGNQLCDNCQLYCYTSYVMNLI